MTADVEEDRRPMQPGTSGDFDSIRIHVHLRGADVALMEEMGSAEVWYFQPHADLPPADELPSWCIKVTPLTAVARLLRTRARTIEIPEPLWARFLPVGFTLMVVARIARLTTGRPLRTVFYALENNDPDRALFGSMRVPTLVRRSFVAVLGLAITPLVDRVAFGSPSAERAYKKIPTFKLHDGLVLTALPARPEAPEQEDPSPQNRAVFVGGLELRKGIRPLLRAWEAVERRLPTATLTVIGSGPLEAEVRRWAGGDPERRIFVGRVRHADLTEYYDPADVLIAPSVRDGRWREQIGLQLREALSRGLTVVASDETGLADWLIENGHHVVPAAELEGRLAGAIAAALSAPLSRSAVRQSLPAVDGRVLADTWLHQRARNSPR